MESKKIQVGRMEHYAVYLALVISMVTTFLLGVLLTESLFGTGLNYFGRLAEDGSISGASAREPLQWTGAGFKVAKRDSGKRTPSKNVVTMEITKARYIA